jgi:hypothetical protein
MDDPVLPGEDLRSGLPGLLAPERFELRRPAARNAPSPQFGGRASWAPVSTSSDALSSTKAVSHSPRHVRRTPDGPPLANAAASGEPPRTIGIPPLPLQPSLPAWFRPVARQVLFLSMTADYKGPPEVRASKPPT